MSWNKITASIFLRFLLRIPRRAACGPHAAPMLGLGWGFVWFQVGLAGDRGRLPTNTWTLSFFTSSGERKPCTDPKQPRISQTKPHISQPRSTCQESISGCPWVGLPGKQGHDSTGGQPSTCHHPLHPALTAYLLLELQRPSATRSLQGSHRASDAATG